MNTSITKRRKEVEASLAEENTRTIVDNFLHWIGRGKSISIWNSIVVIFMLTALIGLFFVFISGTFTNLYSFGRNLSSGFTIWILSNLFACTASMILANAFFHVMVAVLRDQVLDVVESHTTFDAIQTWVGLFTRRKIVLNMTVLVGALVSGFYVVLLLRDQFGLIINYGLVISFMLFSLQSTIFLGFIFLILIFALRLRLFELRLFESDPSNSEIITRLSGLFSNFVYLVAVYGAIQTFGIVRTGLTTYYIPLMILFWTPIIIIFIGSQLGLAKIIQRSKWKTLNSIQKKIASLQKEQILPNTEDRESIKWLLDYHEKVMSTRNSALDLRSWLNFLNSLLLPLIAFIFGNIDTLLKLLSGQP